MSPHRQCTTCWSYQVLCVCVYVSVYLRAARTGMRAAAALPLFDMQTHWPSELFCHHSTSLPSLAQASTHLQFPMKHSALILGQPAVITVSATQTSETCVSASQQPRKQPGNTCPGPPVTDVELLLCISGINDAPAQVGAAPFAASAREHLVAQPGV